MGESFQPVVVDLGRELWIAISEPRSPSCRSNCRVPVHAARWGVGTPASGHICVGRRHGLLASSYSLRLELEGPQRWVQQFQPRDLRRLPQGVRGLWAVPGPSLPCSKCRTVHLLLCKCTDVKTENLHFVLVLLAPSMEDSHGLMKLDTKAKFQ